MKNVARLVFLFVTLLAMPSCQCFQPAHRNDPACAILNQVVDCTESAVIANINQFKPLVQALIAKATGQGGQIDWTQVEASLGGIGVKDGGCILADIEKDYLTPATGMKAEAPLYSATKASYHENYKTYRAKKWPGVKFKVKKATGDALVVS